MGKESSELIPGKLYIVKHLLGFYPFVSYEARREYKPRIYAHRGDMLLLLTTTLPDKYSTVMTQYNWAEFLFENKRVYTEISTEILKRNIDLVYSQYEQQKIKSKMA
jgi:hypothetical protein